MSNTHETAYPRLKSDFTEQELKEYYTPTPAEYTLAGTAGKPVPRLGFLLHLKLFQRLGYFVPLAQAPREIIENIAAEGRFLHVPSKKQLAEYDQSGTKTRHQKSIRRHLGVKVLSDKDRDWLNNVAESAAETKEALQDIINVMMEELILHRFELPGFSVWRGRHVTKSTNAVINRSPPS